MSQQQADRQAKPGDPTTSESQGPEPVLQGQSTDALGGTAAGVVQESTQAEDGSPKVAQMVEQPAKVMRIGTMIKQLLEEVRSAPLDEAGRAHLADVHRRSVTELEDGLAPELVDELRRIALPLADDGTPPSEAELRIAQAQLVGWLEGLFHGIQAAVFAQQAAAAAQLQQMRHAALPAGPQGHPGVGRTEPGTGQYL